MRRILWTCGLLTTAGIWILWSDRDRPAYVPPAEPAAAPRALTLQQKAELVCRLTTDARLRAPHTAYWSKYKKFREIGSSRYLLETKVQAENYSRELVWSLIVCQVSTTQDGAEIDARSANVDIERPEILR